MLVRNEAEERRLPKLQGLALYAEAHPDIYRRIEAVAKVGGTLRVLDLADATVRRAVSETKDAKGLYEASVESNY